MMDSALLLAQIVATAGLAGWLTTGVLDNLLHLSLNETYTAEVMSMARMRAECPEAYQLVAHRAVQADAYRYSLFVPLLWLKRQPTCCSGQEQALSS